MTLVVLGVAACGGDDDGETTTSPATTAPAPPEDPSGGAAPPSGGGMQLPPGIEECLADKGYQNEPSELHSVPQEVLSECFEALHGGGGAP